MNLVPIFKKVVIGAAEASLDVAGAAFLPGAWPILKGALEPVLDRLKERLGGEDITSTPKLAEKAVAEFEADRHLQEMLRSNLVERLDTLVKGQEKIDTDIQKLLLVVTGNQNLLKELVGGVERVEQRLEEGVNLSDEAVEKLTQAISRQAENSRQVRALALREMGPVAQLIKRQVSRLQVRAVELIQERALDRASDELREGLLLIAALLNEAPTDISLRLHLGFIHKTLAQVFEAAGNTEQAEAHIKRAEELFLFVKDDVASDQKTALDIANAIHGLGNVRQQRGDYKGAIENYRFAISLFPDHMYAWHDIFVACYELAKRGQVNLEAMREALDRLKQTGEGKPGLGAQHIANLESILIGIEQREFSGTEKTGEETPTVRKTNDVEQRASGAQRRGKLWDNGAHIKVAFIGGTQELHEEVRKASSEWTKYANIVFEFGAAISESQIRISFERGLGSFSFVGRDALNVHSSQATMNIDPAQKETDLRVAMLVNFGHAIGLQNEDQNPNAKIPWNEEAVYKEFMSAPYFWPRGRVAYMMQKWSPDSFPFEKEYDKDSIMHIQIRNEWTLGDFRTDQPSELSEGDKQWVARLYPRE